MLEIQFFGDLVLRFGGLKNSFYLCIRNSETGCSGVSVEKSFLNIWSNEKSFVPLQNQPQKRRLMEKSS